MIGWVLVWSLSPSWKRGKWDKPSEVLNLVNVVFSIFVWCALDKLCIN